MHRAEDYLNPVVSSDRRSNNSKSFVLVFVFTIVAMADGIVRVVVKWLTRDDFSFLAVGSKKKSAEAGKRKHQLAKLAADRANAAFLSGHYESAPRTGGGCCMRCCRSICCQSCFECCWKIRVRGAIFLLWIKYRYYEMFDRPGAEFWLVTLMGVDMIEISNQVNSLVVLSPKRPTFWVFSASGILIGTGLTCMIPACMVYHRGTSNLLRAKFTLLFIETSFDLLWISLGLYYTNTKTFGTTVWFTAVMGVSFLPVSQVFRFSDMIHFDS